MNKTKIEQAIELQETQMWKDFNKIDCLDSYLEIQIMEEEENLRCINEQTLLDEVEYFSDMIASPDELCYIRDMLYNNPKKVYKLRSQVKYYLKKWGR
jgi:hypothetical protein